MSEENALMWIIAAVGCVVGYAIGVFTIRPSRRDRVLVESTIAIILLALLAAAAFCEEPGWQPDGSWYDGCNTWTKTGPDGTCLIGTDAWFITSAYCKGVEIMPPQEYSKFMKAHRCSGKYCKNISTPLEKAKYVTDARK